MSDAAAVQLGFALPLRADDGPPAPLGHRSPRWSDWDGGQIGGRPSWLNPRDLPQSPLRCRGPCSQGKEEGTALRFVAQLYCPADDATGNEAAFHRSLYVFACPTCCNGDGGSDSPSTRHLSSCVRVLRCQLPKHNDFYPATGDGDEEEAWTNHTSEHWAKETNDDRLNLCAVCGQRSRGKCPKQKLWFCGPEHQKECLRASKVQTQEKDAGDGDVSLKHLPSVCYESELVVEEEPSAADSPAETNGATNSLFPSKDITDADAELEQKDLNALTGNTALATAATGVTDPTTLAFYARMAVGGEEHDVRDQCLRYCRWPEQTATQESEKASDEDDGDEDDKAGPLWISSDHRPPSSFPPPCEHCGADRAFEFQVLPQMLHSLLHDPYDEATTAAEARPVLTENQRAVLLEAKSKIESGADLPEGFLEQHEAAVASAREALLGGAKGGTGEGSKGGLDWGTIAVYTCTASCGDGGVASEANGAYREEAAWVQPPLDGQCRRQSAAAVERSEATGTAYAVQTRKPYFDALTHLRSHRAALQSAGVTGFDLFEQMATISIEYRLQEERAHRCERCWYDESRCVCDRMPERLGIELLRSNIGGDGSNSSNWAGNVKFLLLMHHKEYLNAGNSAKTLLQLLPEEMVKLYVYGQCGDFDRFLAEIEASDPKHRMTLWPGVRSRPLKEFVGGLDASCNGNNANDGEATPQLIIVVLDGTYNHARNMQKTIQRRLGDRSPPNVALHPTTTSKFHRARKGYGANIAKSIQVDEKLGDKAALRISTAEAVGLCLVELGADEKVAEWIERAVLVNNVDRLDSRK